MKATVCLKTSVDGYLPTKLHGVIYRKTKLKFSPPYKIHFLISTGSYSLFKIQRLLVPLETQHCSRSGRNGALRHRRCGGRPASIQLPIILLLISVYPTHFPPMSTHKNIAVGTHYVGLGSHLGNQLILYTQHYRRPLKASLWLVTKIASSDHYVSSNHVVYTVYTLS
jgi:hypothetical protein